MKVRFPDDSNELRFLKPGQLAEQRNNLYNYIARIEKDPQTIADYVRDQYGISVRDLVPIAEPNQYSRCVAIHLGKGERFGGCFHWDHDGAWELEQATPSFDAALKAITSGIEGRDKMILEFIGIYLD